MSVKVMQWVFEHSRASPTQRLVLLSIADHANDDGIDAYPSLATLRSKTGLSERTIQSSLGRLVALGELAVRLNAGPRGCNRYQIIMDPAGDAPPQEMRGGAGDAGVTPAGNAPPPAAAAPHPRRKCGGTPAAAAPEPSFNHPSTISTTFSSELRPDVERICDHLADRIEANGSKRPRITEAWRTAARLLLDTDKRTEAQILSAITWCQEDPFWRANILSMIKLRAKYDQLRLAAQRSRGHPKQSTTDQRVAQGLALAAAFEAKEITA